MADELPAALLPLLRCPLTGQPLRPATPAEASRFGLAAAVIREDGEVAYPWELGFPDLRPGSAQKPMTR